MNSASKRAQKYFTIQNIQSARELSSALVRKYKIAVFVPLKNADELAFHMASKGAGKIGEYTVCSFRTKGVGTFLGSKASNPSAGKKGRFEMLEEIRLEMICGSENVHTVLDEIYRVHPYEEPACEVYEVLVRDKNVNSMVTEIILKKGISASSMLKKINPKIAEDRLPAFAGKLMLKRFVIDSSGVQEIEFPSGGLKTMYIRKKNKEIKIEIV